MQDLLNVNAFSSQPQASTEIHNAPPDYIDGSLETPFAWNPDSNSPGTTSISSSFHSRHQSALRLAYQYDEGSSARVMLYGPSMQVKDAHRFASYWAKGDASMHQLVLFVIDCHFHHHSYKAITVDWTGWQRIHIDLLSGFRSHWGPSSASERVSFPVRQAGFILWRGEDSDVRNGSIHLSDLKFHSPRHIVWEEISSVQKDYREVGRGPMLGNQFNRAMQIVETRLGQLRMKVNSGVNNLDNCLHKIHRLRGQYELLRAWAEGGVQIARRSALIGFLSASEKIPPEEQIPSNTFNAQLTAACGERADVQLIVQTLDEPIENLEIEISSLCHEDTKIELVDALKCNPLGNVEVHRGSSGRCKKRLWPDVLLDPGPVSIPELTSQAFWVSVTVPRDAIPGNYNATIRTTISKSNRLKLSLRVFGFTLPNISYLKTAIGINTWNIAQYYGRGELSDVEYLQWVEFLLDRRIHGDRLVGSYHWAKQLEEIIEMSPETVLEAQCERFDLVWSTRITNKLLIPENEQKRIEAEKNILQHLPKIEQELSQRKLLSKAYLYTYDELGAEHYAKAIPFLRACGRAAPSLKTVLTFYRDDPTKALEPYVDVWCPHIRWVEENWDKVHKLQQSGAEVWWYFTSGDSNWPNISIDGTALNHRILFWQTFQFGFAGVLHWESCEWGANLNAEKRWPSTPWIASQINSKTDDYIYHGNGQLLYPGPDSRPLSSVRLEMMRKGAEDFEYLSLLQDRLDRGLVSEHLRGHAEQLLDLSGLIKSVTHYEQDIRCYERRRSAIAALLEQVDGT